MLYKLCRCGKKIPIIIPYCEDCQKKVRQNKRDQQKYYDQNLRKNYDIYHSPIWLSLRDQCKSRFTGIDVYQYYKYNKLVEGTLAHHIVPVEDDKSLIYDLDNLVFVSDRTHAEIHSLYDCGQASREATQALLRGYRDRWLDEMS